MTQSTPDDSREAFARIYQSNEWGSAESRSGLQKMSPDRSVGPGQTRDMSSGGATLSGCESYSTT